MTSAPIRVTIFDNIGEAQCSGCYRINRSLEEVAVVTQHLKRRYGDEVDVEYIDLAESESGDVTEQIRTQNLPLPVVAINGVLRLAGGVEYREIMEAIDTLKEVGLE